jgi:hypothetical protein
VVILQNSDVIFYILSIEYNNKIASRVGLKTLKHNVSTADFVSIVKLNAEHIRVSFKLFPDERSTE